jgi:hypothetical protein
MIVLVGFLLFVVYTSVSMADNPDLWKDAWKGIFKPAPTRAATALPSATQAAAATSTPRLTNTPPPAPTDQPTQPPATETQGDQGGIPAGFTPIELPGNYAGAALKTLFVNAPYYPEPEGVPFLLHPGSLAIESASSSSGNPPLFSLPVGMKGARRLHLLLNLSHSTPALAGQVVARLRLLGSDGEHAFELVAGEELRDWYVGHAGVLSSLSGDTTELWQDTYPGSGEAAVIDWLRLDVPDGLGETLVAVEIEDLSQSCCGGVNPGLVLWGLTIER